jgi:hypothetical protein
MNLSTGNTPDVVLIPEDHTLIISDKHGVNFKCTRCGGTKDYYSHEVNRDLEWLQACKCKRYDTVPLSSEQLPTELTSLPLPADAIPLSGTPATFRLVNREGEA